MEWTRLSDMRQVHWSPSCDKTLLQTYSTGNTLSLQITFLPINFTLTSFYSLLFIKMCLTLCQEGKKKKDINITRVVIMLWKRQHEKGVERQESLKEERWEVPLSSASGTGGVSHPVERHNAKWLFLRIPLWGSNEVERLFTTSQLCENPPRLTVRKEALCFISVFISGPSIRSEEVAASVHKLLVYNCLWSASSVVVKQETHSQGHQKLQLSLVKEETEHFRTSEIRPAVGKI